MIESQTRFPQPITEEYLNDVAQTIADAITAPSRTPWSLENELAHQSPFADNRWDVKLEFFENGHHYYGNQEPSQTADNLGFRLAMDSDVYHHLVPEIKRQQQQGLMPNGHIGGNAFFRPITEEQHNAAVEKLKGYLRDWGVSEKIITSTMERAEQTVQHGLKHCQYQDVDPRNEFTQEIMRQIYENRANAPFETIESREHGKIFMVPAGNDMAVSFWKNKGDANDLRATISQKGLDGERNVIARVVPPIPVGGDYLEQREKAIAADRETNRLIGQIFETLFEREAKWLRAAKLVVDLIKNLNHNNRDQGRHH